MLRDGTTPLAGGRTNKGRACVRVGPESRGPRGFITAILLVLGTGLA